jgi:hypothetical protein
VRGDVAIITGLGIPSYGGKKNLCNRRLYTPGVSDIIIYMITSDYGSRSGSIIYDSTWEHLPQESSTSLEES